MADETGREDIEGISIDEFMGASDESSAEGEFGGVMDDISIDGAIDDIFNIDDINLDDISLSDLMIDDLDEDVERAEEADGSAASVLEDIESDGADLNESEINGAFSVQSDNELLMEEEPAEQPESGTESLPTEADVLSDVSGQADDIAASDDMEVSREDTAEEVQLSEEIQESIEDLPDSGDVEMELEDDGAEAIADIDDINVNEDVMEEVESDEDIDLMQLLTGGDDDFELLDDEDIIQEDSVGSQEPKTGESEDAAKTEKATKKGNVFADPLSVLSDDKEKVAVGEVEELLVNAKEKSRKKKKKSGKGIGKLFSNIVDEKELEKVEQEKREAEQAEKKKAADAEKKQKQAEEKAAKKEEQKLAKEQLKESKKQEKEAKKRAKKEAKELRKLEEETEVEGRINKVGAAIVFAVIGCIALFIFFGTKMFSYNSSVSNAMSYFEAGRYEDSYQELVGEDLKEEDMVLYNKVVTVMYVYKQLDAYDAYYKAGQYPQALDSLLKGVREYDKYMPDAIEFDITDNFDSIKNQIIAELSAEYGITEDMAREINNISDSAEYSKKVYSLAQNLSSNYY